MIYKIQTLNNISDLGLKKFDPKRYTISDKEKKPDAILVRSTSMHSLDLPQSVLVIGRAGAGTNNIPIKKMAELGIPVLNTPGGNANAVKELVLTGMLLACRHIAPALNYTKELSGSDREIMETVEKNKKHFRGSELPNRTLGIIGLGKIGVKVANAAIALGMKVIGHDPAMTVQNAWELSANAQQAQSIEEVLMSSDFISVHVPLIEKTEKLISSKLINKMKKGTVLLNFSRAEIVDSDAIATALQKEIISQYVCDFPCKAFQNNSKVIALPHLGASTQEAEENCAIMISEQVQEYLEHGHITHSVNFPRVKLIRSDAEQRLTIINRNVPNIIAQVSSILSQSKINIRDMINKSRQDIAYNILDVNANIDHATLEKIKKIKGVLQVRAL